MADDGGELEIWGDGHQTCSYCFIEDCIDGILPIDVFKCLYAPLNLGQDRMTTVDQLVDLVAAIAGETH